MCRRFVVVLFWTEGDWILKGVKEVKDENVNTVMEQGLARKENKKYEHIKIKIKSSGNVVAATENGPSTTTGQRIVETVSGFASKLADKLFAANAEENRRKSSLAAAAAALKEQEKEQRRRQFLIDNSHHVRVLQRGERRRVIDK